MNRLLEELIKITDEKVDSTFPIKPSNNRFNLDVTVPNKAPDLNVKMDDYFRNNKIPEIFGENERKDIEKIVKQYENNR